ncbi:DUF1345 domain-containing protein [Aquamicrobium sp. LC103]|uniref:DUF1345 domain-containing protein n=1 Tax=Aquamicrobium sp. LC103 TaxID=1120658 RepID=UPI00063E7088|nr:DUF1345 domain-containing protein [Aquamicrobium sp. LC103]TKT76816.1 DUF1345 domain-containing protein [Aquamicrobium sp. LC103]
MRTSNRHFPFYLAAGTGAAAFAASVRFDPLLATVIAANAFFATYLLLTLARLPRLTAQSLRKHAASDDVPVWIIFLVTFSAVIVAVISLFVMLNAGTRPGFVPLILTIAAVPLGWLTIHIMAAIHYAHAYWQPDRSTAAADDSMRGLEFPGTKEPRGVDFVYFSLVIGMTAQTSDVQITTHAMRRINILHAVVSFFFNTVLVAAAVNAAVSLGN